MHASNSRRTSLAAVFAIAAMLVLQPALAMTVKPVVIDLETSGRGMSQVVTVENTSAARLPVELQVHELTLSENGTTQASAESADLVVFPPQAIIAPGETQTFRIQYVGEPVLGESKHYYATVAQLPVTLSGEQAGIQILYNFEVLISVGPQGVKPAMRIASARLVRNNAGESVPLIRLANESATYGYLSRGQLHIIARNAEGAVSLSRVLSGGELQQTLGMGLVASGQTRDFVVPIILPADTAAVEARFVPGR